MAIRVGRAHRPQGYIQPEARKHKKSLKKKSDDELLYLVKHHLEGGGKDPLQLHEAVLALCELSIRPIANTYKKQISHIIEKLSEKANTCFVDLFYAIEVAGVKKRCFDDEADSDEVIHPYPRADIMKKIRSEWLSNYQSTISFDNYICTHIPQNQKEKVEKIAIQYLTERQRSDYLLTFKNGRVYIGTKAAEDVNYIFIVTPDGKEMYAGRKKKGDFQHTSFFNGEPVLCAGRLTIQDGKISVISLNSGHYKPTPEHGEALRTFLSHPSRLGSDAESLAIEAFSES